MSFSTAGIAVAAAGTGSGVVAHKAEEMLWCLRGTHFPPFRCGSILYGLLKRTEKKSAEATVKTL